MNGCVIICGSVNKFPCSLKNRSYKPNVVLSVILIHTLKIQDVGLTICNIKLDALYKAKEDAYFITWLITILKWNSIRIVDVLDKQVVLQQQFLQ